jgi:hypothetical protein
MFKFIERIKTAFKVIKSGPDSETVKVINYVTENWSKDEDAKTVLLKAMSDVECTNIGLGMLSRFGGLDVLLNNFSARVEISGNEIAHYGDEKEIEHFLKILPKSFNSLTITKYCYKKHKTPIMVAAIVAYFAVQKYCVRQQNITKLPKV